MSMLENKNIIVTGCLQGIGLETLRLFAANRPECIFACAYKSDEGFEEECRKLSAEHSVEIIPVYFDLMDNEAVKAAVKTILSYKREIHGIVNIAGIVRDARVGMIAYDDLFATMQVNCLSPIMFTQQIVRWMQRKNTAGSIVFVSSIAAFAGAYGQTSYAASKAALIGAMKSMSKELGSEGIRVNAIAPGVIDTPMTAEVGKEELEKRTKLMDIPRLGLPQEVGGTLLFLISDMSRHITGQVLHVDGGM